MFFIVVSFMVKIKDEVRSSIQFRLASELSQNLYPPSSNK